MKEVNSESIDIKANDIKKQQIKQHDTKKTLLLKIFISSIIILVAIAIIVAVIIVMKRKKIEENYQENSIDAIYKIQSNKEDTFFNYDKLGLKNEDFKIEEIEFIPDDKNDLRNLKDIEIKDGAYTSTKSGTLKIKIIFKIYLNSLDNIFQDKKELIGVNFANFEMKEVKSMKSSFSGCSNLKEINFENINSSNVEDMENTFGNCTELKSLNLSSFNTKHLKNSNSIFFGCNKLEILNLVSFDKIDDNLFNGISSKPKIVANENISYNITKKFFDLFKIKITIEIEIDIEIKDECEIGEKEKCKTCSSSITSNCLSCNDGYYLPYNEINNKVCLPININHCIYGIGEKNLVTCVLCETGYKLENNKCEEELKECTIGDNEKCQSCNSKSNLRNQCENCNYGYYLPSDGNKIICEKCNKIEKCLECSGTKKNPICQKCENGYETKNGLCELKLCEIGEREKCKSCNSNKNFQNQCENCNYGYYLPSDGNKIICEKCSIENCLECSGTRKNIICEKCENGYEIKSGICELKQCEIGENEKCKSCRMEKNRQNECFTCNEGYYIPENSNSQTCVKCSIDNCKRCSNNSICLECKANFIETKNNKGFIESCSCPSDYKYYNGFCQKYENWIEITYDFNLVYGDNYNLINTLNTGIQLSEVEAYVNNLPIQIQICSDWHRSPICYNFNKKGVYTIKMNIKKTLTSMEYLFASLFSIKSVKFLKGFDSSKVTTMVGMFDNTNIKSIDMQYLDTSKVLDMNGFIRVKGLFYLNVLDNENGNYIMDFSSLNTSNIKCFAMFNVISKNIIIKISNLFSRCKEQIPYENTIINADEIACNNIFKCIECKGSKEDLYCFKCELGYEIKDGICQKSTCDSGLNEKCLTCKSDIGKENECFECNEGYYIPLNSIDKSKCIKCPINGCSSCNEKGICQRCQLYHKPIYDDNNKKILSCELTCDLGANDKCLSCSLINGKESECSQCNIGYKLMKSGICKKIENSFISIYNSKSTSNPTKIMELTESHLKLTDFDMYINNKKVTPYIQRNYFEKDEVLYKFPSVGQHEVKIIFKKSLSTMNSLFYTCPDLMSIKFSETFDTSKVLSMSYAFSYCDSLSFIDVSSFNTSLVTDLSLMFYNSKSLTSLDLSSFDTKNVYTFQDLTSHCTNLKYIDLSNFETSNGILQSSLLIYGLHQSGTLVVGKKFRFSLHNLIDWKIIYK